MQHAQRPARLARVLRERGATFPGSPPPANILREDLFLSLPLWLHANILSLVRFRPATGLVPPAHGPGQCSSASLCRNVREKDGGLWRLARFRQHAAVPRSQAIEEFRQKSPREGLLQPAHAWHIWKPPPSPRRRQRQHREERHSWQYNASRTETQQSSALPGGPPSLSQEAEGPGIRFRATTGLL